MRFHAVARAPVGFLVISLLAAAAPAAAPAQSILKKAKNVAKQAAEDEVLNKVDQTSRNTVNCVFDDLDCIRNAEEAGQDVILVDDEGEVIEDDEGAPMSDPGKAAARAPKPGEGAWANYDFVPGERVLFFDDYSKDNVGDFPRRLEFVKGPWEIIEWEGRPLLAVSDEGIFEVPLPEVLPEKFTIEFDVFLSNGVETVWILPSTHDAHPNSYPANYFQVDDRETGVNSSSKGVESMRTSKGTFTERVTPIRIMVDGRYAKMYVNETRVANVPNAEFQRGDRVRFHVRWARDDQPVYIGMIRVGAGGRDLYDRLASEGRVATQGILFATGSDRIRPESTPTLKEIGAMLSDHPELRISIEGHTDSDGDDASNQELSERRAAAVKRYLVEKHGIDASRLETAGFGESKPAADNATPEGKQQNRRVELVKLN